jgi:hypothetical protein
MKITGNRYSMGLTLTQREAETLRGCIKKINVIKNKKDRYIGEEYKLNNVVIALKKIIVDAGREYVLTDKEY